MQPSTSGRNGGGSNGGGGSGGEDGEGASRPRYSRLGKDPSVRTDFLPDKDRQREEDELREKLKVGGAGWGGCGKDVRRGTGLGTVECSSSACGW